MSAATSSQSGEQTIISGIVMARSSVRLRKESKRGQPALTQQNDRNIADVVDFNPLGDHRQDVVLDDLEMHIGHLALEHQGERLAQERLGTARKTSSIR